VIRGWEASVRAGGTNDRRYAHSFFHPPSLADRMWQDKLVRLGPQHFLRRHPKGSCCRHCGEGFGYHIWHELCAMVDLQLSRSPNLLPSSAARCPSPRGSGGRLVMNYRQDYDFLCGTYLYVLPTFPYFYIFL